MTGTAVRARPCSPPLNLPLVCSSRWFGTGQVGTAPTSGGEGGEGGGGGGGSSHTDSRSPGRHLLYPPNIFPPKGALVAAKGLSGCPSVGCSCLGQLFVLPCASHYLDLITDPRIPHLQLKYFSICPSAFIHSQNLFRSWTIPKTNYHMS